MKFPTTQAHYTKFTELAKLWGFSIEHQEKVFGCGYTREQVRELLRKDPHLNNVPLPMWDRWAAHFTGKRQPFDNDGNDTGKAYGASLGDAVCMLKTAVKLWSGAEPVFVHWTDESLRGNYPRRPEWDQEEA